jgi:hypothetical protein
MIELKQLYDVTYVVTQLPNPLEEGWGDGWILGTVSVSHPTRRERYVRYGHAYVINDHIFSSRDIARAWVRTYYDLDRLRRKHRMWEYAPVPHWARAGKYDEAYYIDIRGLHREIISRVGYDVEYSGPGTYLSLNPIAVRLNKACYTSLSSLSINPVTTLRKTKNHSIVCVNIHNRYANTSLYRLIRDVQLAIASDVLRTVGVVYYNTDGCIVTCVHDVDHVLDIVSAWGMTARIKREGRCVVWRHAAYAFDEEIERVAMRLSRQRLWTRARELTLMSERECAWLRARLNDALNRDVRETCDLSALPAAEISYAVAEESESALELEHSRH